MFANWVADLESVFLPACHCAIPRTVSFFGGGVALMQATISLALLVISEYVVHFRSCLLNLEVLITVLIMCCWICNGRSTSTPACVANFILRWIPTISTDPNACIPMGF